MIRDCRGYGGDLHIEYLQRYTSQPDSCKDAIIAFMSDLLQQPTKIQVHYTLRVSLSTHINLKRYYASSPAHSNLDVMFGIYRAAFYSIRLN